MALARVQTTAKVTGTSTGSVAIPFTTPPAVGNAIIVPVLGRASGITFPVSGCIDNYGNTYVRAATINQTSGTDTACAIYYCAAVATTGVSFTVSAPVSNTANYSACAIEVESGLVLDQSKTAIGTSVTPATGATAALTVDDEFVVAVHSIGTTNLTSITVETVSPVWTEAFEQLSLGAGEADSRILTTATGLTTSASWTLSASFAWAAVLAAFKAGAVVEATPARVSQSVIELLTQGEPEIPPPPIRVSQSPVEILDQYPTAAYVSQVPLESVQQFAASLTAARLSQAPLEIIYPFGCYIYVAPRVGCPIGTDWPVD